MKRSNKGAAISAALISLGLAFAGITAAPAHAASEIEFQAKKLNADQLLKKQQQAISFILKNYKALPKDKRGKSAPFLKALSATAKNIKAVTAAAQAKDNKKFAAILPELAASVAQVNATFKLSGIKDHKVALGVKTLDKVWSEYLKRVKGGKAANSQEIATKNGRRINDMKRRLDTMAANKAITKNQKRELDQLRRQLDKASDANKRGNQQWYAVMLLADFDGYYAGYYYWYSAYDQNDSAFYRDSWEYFSTTSSYFYSETSSYYESYSWESYELSVETSESYDFEYTSEEYQSFESEYESTEETLETSVEEEYSATEEDQSIEQAEDYDSNETVDDAADNPDPEADAASDMQDEQADAADDNSYLDDSTDAQDMTTDDPSDDQSADSPDASDDASATADDDGQNDSVADDASDDASMDNDSSADESSADDSASDDSSADDSAADDSAADDSAADDSAADDSSGDE
ncbi:hypothetical protein JJB09_05190 [Rhizobium sp. KVB221]|uniref:Uncharacterized protein n=1 Tax=Rhizobium setariae TaxID=2801340 RepID=A0A936YRF9_9HYPH|nr:hypothetical protein [Rhizobium setariae]MBL0371416.1 hypothetical protein [Rhizobium setariae]